MKIFVLGGVKSGKSRFALKLAERFSPPKLFLATAEPIDPEMQEKIKRHRAERGIDWETLEEPLEISYPISQSKNYGVCLIDCLTVWLGNLWYYKRVIDIEIEKFLRVLRDAKGNFILVSNEVGLGVLPAESHIRRYIDALGSLNQEVASICDEVYLVVAGLILTLKH